MGASSTLLQIRQFIAQEMGGMGQGGFHAGVASGGTSNTLVDTSWPVMTTLSVDEQWRDAWVFRPNAVVATDKVRLVDTYTPNSGTFTVDSNYTNAPIALEPYEIHTVIEPLTHMNIIINEALKRCMLETEVAAIPTVLDTVHSLALVAPWLERKSWVRQVGYLGVNDLRARLDPYTRVIRGEAYEADGGVFINTYPRTFLATDVLYIHAMKPAYNCVNGNAKNGMSADTDTVAASFEWVGWAAIVEAWRRYGQILETGAKQRMIPTRGEAAAMFSDKNKDNCRWPILTFRPLIFGGPANTSRPSAYKATTA